MGATLKRFDRPTDMLKLLIPIRMVSSFLDFAVGLETVIHVMQKPDDRRMSYLVPLPLQFLSQLAAAFTRPSQRRLRVTAGIGIQ